MKKVVFKEIISGATFAHSQTKESDKLIGVYITEDKDGKVEITKQNGKYYGKLIWIDQPNKLDEYNPDPNKRKNKVIGTVIMNDFVYAGNRVYEKGTLYDPKSGNTYSGTLTLDKSDNLKMRGYVGISLFGKSTYWTRVK